MHSFSETGTGVPAFLAKLWRLVDDPETNHLICWSKDGRTFVIQNQAQFARELLPLNYKHNNMASFIRQLNMYGFHKITSIDNGGLKFDRDEMEFSHPCFKRNCPYLLEHIKRKIANAKSLDEKSAIKPEAVSKVLQDVKSIRGRQDSLDSRFSVMKQENEALWREIASLRQKHAKQQQIVNKLIQFLITIVQPSRNMTSVKRHMQLMINDAPNNEKSHKSTDSKIGNGPVIHELEEELLDEVVENELDIIEPNSPYAASVHTANLDHESQSPLSIDRPHSNISIMSQNYDYSNQSTEDVVNVGTFSASSSAAAASAADNGGKSIIQSVNSDGSEIVYHVTEVSDSHSSMVVQTGVPENYSDRHILTTPMVREQIACSELLKQKNKLRRDLTDVSLPISLKVHRKNLNEDIADVASTSANENELKIKSEQEIDPMLFLNVYSDNRLITPESSMIMQNLSEDTRFSNSDIISDNPENSNAKTSHGASILNNQSDNLYNSNDFLTVNIPSDIFEDSSLIGERNRNLAEDFKVNFQTRPKLQSQQFLEEEQKKQRKQQVRNIASINGKFSSLFPGNNNCSGASTSAAAAAAAVLPTLQDHNKKNKDNLMVMAKFNKNFINSNDGFMRDDVHGHLENMQDELESLKDLLRGDGYSLDANTLLSLFNDADVLGPYGLSMTSESAGEKKGSELMAYQPIYDLSDIIDINDKSNFDDTNPISSTTTASGCDQQCSALNTPYHE